MLHFDPFSRHVYVPHGVQSITQDPTVYTPLQAFDLCKTKMPNVMTRWEIPTVGTLNEFNLIMKMVSLVGQSTGWAVNLRHKGRYAPYRFTNGERTSFIHWVHAGDTYYCCANNWHEQFPYRYSATNNIFNFVISHLAWSGQYIDEDGANANVLPVVCESDVWEFNGTVSWIMDPANMSSSVEVTPLTYGQLTAPSVAADQTKMAFGAVLSTPVSECRSMERFVLLKSNDRIGLYNQIQTKDCLLMLVGVASYTEYIEVLQNVRWRAVYPWRSTVRFSFMYYSQPHMIEYVASALDGSVSVPMWGQKNAYQLTDGSSRILRDEPCSQRDPALREAEWASEQQRQEIFRQFQRHTLFIEEPNSLSFGWAFVGARLVGTVHQFDNNGRTLPGGSASHDWYPGYPSTSYGRVGMSQINYISNTHEWYYYPVLCSSNAGYSGTVLANVTVPSMAGETHSRSYTRRRVIPEETYDRSEFLYHPVDRNVEMNWIPDGAYFFGATLMMRSCGYRNELRVDVSSIEGASGIRATYVPVYCTFYFHGHAQGWVFKNILGNTTYRGGAAQFAWLLWSAPEYKRVQYDFAENHAYAEYNASAAHWLGSHWACREFGMGGRDWYLTTMNDVLDLYVFRRRRAVCVGVKHHCDRMRLCR